MLSDDFERIVNQINLKNNQSINEGLKEMVQLGFGYIEDQMRQNSSAQTMLDAFQRVHNVWNFVAANAAKRGRGIMKVDGFKELVRADDEFKEIHDRI